MPIQHSAPLIRTDGITSMEYQINGTTVQLNFPSQNSDISALSNVEEILKRAFLNGSIPS